MKKLLFIIITFTFMLSACRVKQSQAKVHHRAKYDSPKKKEKI